MLWVNGLLRKRIPLCFWPSSGFVCPIAIATARALEALLSFIIGGQNAFIRLRLTPCTLLVAHSLNSILSATRKRKYAHHEVS